MLCFIYGISSLLFALVLFYWSRNYSQRQLKFLLRQQCVYATLQISPIDLNFNLTFDNFGINDE